jgi:hypothetical protein
MWSQITKYFISQAHKICKCSQPQLGNFSAKKLCLCFHESEKDWSSPVFLNSAFVTLRGYLSLQELYTFRIFSDEYIFKNILKVFDSPTQAKLFACLESQIKITAFADFNL